jgi:chitinase
MLSASSSASMVAGIYAGAGIDSAESIQEVISRVLQHVDENGLGEALVAQICGPDGERAQTLGLAVSTKGDLTFVQRALHSWNNGTCVEGLDSTAEAGEVSIAIRTTASQIESRGTAKRSPAETQRQKRDTCSYIQVIPGDSCGALASRCGITGAQFESFNRIPSLCSTLQVDQFVCCSAGTLPDFSPQPNPDGNCATYTVQSGDWCDLIAQNHFIESADIETFNGGTWGWAGCQFLQTGQAICVSQGELSSQQPLEL